MKLYAILGLTVVILGAFGGTYYVGDKNGFNRCKVAVEGHALDAAIEARHQERTKQQEVNNVLRDQITERDAINDRLVSDIKRLHKRPDRRHVSETAESRCQGASGRELSGPDAFFLTRLAARAEKQRAALNACYAYADAVVR